MKEPYLSIVVVARNDKHGGGMFQRMRVSINGLLEQLERHRIESELILVEWNPPPGKPLLKDVIEWPDNLRYCSIRSIVVSPGYVVNPIVAVNCGIRRARGKFVLPSPIDLLYSDELVSFIASKNLKGDERYRIDRCDVDRGVVQLGTLGERLDYCWGHIIKVNRRMPFFARLLLYHGLPKFHTNACGDFQLMARKQWHLLRGYCEGNNIVAHVDSLLSYASYVVGIKEVVLKSPMRLYHIDHDLKFNDRVRRVGPHPSFERWLSSLIGRKAMAYYYGLVELLGGGVKSSIDEMPVLDSSECHRMCREIVSGRRSCIFNDAGWGLGKERLGETLVSIASWDRVVKRGLRKEVKSCVSV